MPFVVGETIGPYRILEQLGRGGMATVFKAYHASLDRYVAIKALHPAFMEDPNFLARFQREARVVAKLEHPNIVPIYDFAEYEGRPYLVMKYIEGETLKARLSQGIIEQPELIQIVQAVGTGLFYAHQKGILHRDVKPSNVLLGFDERIYLADFGLARIAQAGESTLSSDMMLGTPQYISPEQAMGLGELDERTDIYSFGVMLYEMAVGQVPFSADTPFSIIHDHIYTPLPLPRTVNPDVPEAMERVLLKALAKERDDRYPDAVALADAFQKAVASETGETPVDVTSVPDETYIADPVEIHETSVTENTAQAAVVTPLPAEMPGEQEALSEPQPKPRRRFRWWYIPIGIIFIIACCFCGLIAYNSLDGSSDSGAPSAEQLPEDPIPAPFQESEQNREPGEAPQVGDAQSWVDENPDDPYAWLNLAEAQWAIGDVDEAKNALNQALDVAGDNPDFYFETADQLADRLAWVEAAHVYLEGILRFHPDQIPFDLLDDFHEAVFWASESWEAESEIPIPAIAEVDLPMERVAKARYLLHFGEIEEAHQITEQVLTEIKPGMPEATLLLAEVFYRLDQVDLAMQTLDDLQARDDVPDWMQAYIEYLRENTLAYYQTALEQVEANPDDPYVHLYLFDVSLAMGLFERADEALQQALSLAPENPDVALTAADMAAKREAWLYSAYLLRHAVQLNPDLLTPEFSNRILQALYYGATEAGALEIFGEIDTFLAEGERGTVRAAYRDALIARHKLYFEDATEAQVLIEEVVSRAPVLGLPRLVQAEVYLFTGDIPQSEAILVDLKNSRVAPPWVRNEAQFMLDEIKP